MTRKDYELIASAINQQVRNAAEIERSPIENLQCLVEGLANRFAAENPNFNRDLFLSACGVK